MDETAILVWVCTLVIYKENIPIYTKICAAFVALLGIVKIVIKLWMAIHGQ